MCASKKVENSVRIKILVLYVIGQVVARLCRARGVAVRFDVIETGRYRNCRHYDASKQCSSK